jgi:hypothetical protein
MAVLVVARLEGDPEELASRILQHLSPAMDEISPALGARWHALAKAADGVVVVDVWESGDGLQRALADPSVQQAIVAGGLPQPHIDVYDLVDYRSL